MSAPWPCGRCSASRPWTGPSSPPAAPARCWPSSRIRTTSMTRPPTCGPAGAGGGGHGADRGVAPIAAPSGGGLRTCPMSRWRTPGASSAASFAGCGKPAANSAWAPGPPAHRRRPGHRRPDRRRAHHRRRGGPAAAPGRGGRGHRGAPPAPMPVRRALPMAAPTPLQARSPLAVAGRCRPCARPEGDGGSSGVRRGHRLARRRSRQPGARLDLHRARAMDKIQRWMPALSELRLSAGWSGPHSRSTAGRSGPRPPDPACGGRRASAASASPAPWRRRPSRLIRGADVPWLPRRGVAPDRPCSPWAIRLEGDLHRTRLVDAVVPPPPA